MEPEPKLHRAPRTATAKRKGGAARGPRAVGAGAGVGAAARQATASGPPYDAQERGQAELLAEVAHQLLTPVTSIKAAAEVLLDDAVRQSLDRTHKDILLQSVVRGVGVLEGLIQQLLQYGQLHMGSARLVPEVIDIAELVQNCVTVIHPTLIARRQQIKVDVAHPLPLLALDIERMEQALLNLLSNASKFSEPVTEVHLSVAARSGHVLLAVQDACGGMKAEEMEHLFQPYARRTRAAAGGRMGGAGLGLALAKGWVELHGGTVTMENEPGRGCTFTISVPSRGSQGEAGPSEPEGEPRPATRASRPYGARAPDGV